VQRACARGAANRGHADFICTQKCAEQMRTTGNRFFPLRLVIAPVNPPIFLCFTCCLSQIVKIQERQSGVLTQREAGDASTKHKGFPRRLKKQLEFYLNGWR
jgi:hypothetical protein